METILGELKSLLPPGVFFEQENDSFLKILAYEFARIKSDTEALLREFDPKWINRILLEDWSRIYDLGDLSVQAKKDEIIRRIFYQGGQDKSVYIDFVKSYGFKDFDVEPCLVSDMDELSCESVLYDQQWIHHFFIRAADLPINYLNCESYCTEPMYENLDAHLKKAIQHMQLAHTKVFITEKPHETH